MHLGRTLSSWGMVVAVGSFSLLSAEPPAADSWQVLEPPGEGFRLELPGKPESQSTELDTKAGRIQIRSYVLNDERRGRTYQAAANRLPAVVTDAEALLNRTRDGAVQSIQGKLLDERKLSVQRHAGRALTIDAGSGRYVFVRLYTADNWLYQVSIVADAAEPTPDDERVLASFQFRDVTPTVEVKPDWRFVTPRNEKLAVEMPGDPQESVGVLDTPLGRVKLNRLECQVLGCTYFVQVCDWPATLGGDAAARLDVARDHAVQSTGGKLVEETPLTMHERSGRAVVIAAGERTLRLRTLIEGPRVYQLGTVGTAETSADEKKFLESLRLPKLDTK